MIFSFRLFPDIFIYFWKKSVAVNYPFNNRGIKVEIIDPRTLVPLDVETMAKSVNKTGRAVIVLQAYYTGSFASDISHEVTGACFKNMKCPIRIISGYDITPPMAYPLETENMPNPERIVKRKISLNEKVRW